MDSTAEASTSSPLNASIPEVGDASGQQPMTTQEPQAAQDPQNQAPQQEQPPVGSTSGAAPTSDAPVASTSSLSGIKVWKPVSASSAPRLPDLPDSYYEPSANQVKAAHLGQQRTLNRLGVDTQFSTKAQRDKEQAEKERKRIQKYPRTAVRIRFPDRHQIETVFPSTVSLTKVYEFAKSVMLPEVRNLPFVLYAPPRQEYKLNDPKLAGKNLLDLQLAPRSVFLIRFTGNDALNDSSKQAPLLPDYLAQAQDLEPPPSFDPTPEQLAGKDKEDGTPGGMEEGKGNKLGSGSGAKIPKWLKVGKK